MSDDLKFSEEQLENLTNNDDEYLDILKRLDKTKKDNDNDKKEEEDEYKLESLNDIIG